MLAGYEMLDAGGCQWRNQGFRHPGSEAVKCPPPPESRQQSYLRLNFIPPWLFRADKQFCNAIFLTVYANQDTLRLHELSFTAICNVSASESAAKLQHISAVVSHKIYL